MMDDLVDSKQIAERLGVADRTIHVWRRRHAEFPEPKRRVAQGVPLFAWGEVEEWARDTGRLKDWRA